MARLVQVVVDGIANGSVYAALALALVLIYRSTGVVNFAQGEMAMFSTFLTWGMTEAGVSLPLAILAALALSFGGGALLERIVIRPVEGRQPLTLVIVTLGLFILINNGAGWLWGFSNRGFPSTFPDGTVGVGGVRLSIESLVIVGVLLVVVGVLLYAFAAATLGGFDSPLGAVLGGWIIGVSENLAGTYVNVIGSDLKILVPLGVILAVLLVRPTGLFGAREVERA